MTHLTSVFQLLQIVCWCKARESTSKRGPVISLSGVLYIFTGKCQEGCCLPSHQSYQATGCSIYPKLSLLNRNQVLKWISSSYSSTPTYNFVVCGERYLITRDVPVVTKRRGPGCFPVPEPGPRGLFTPLTLSAEPKRHFWNGNCKLTNVPRSKGPRFSSY